jgi:2-C-methyl-D-erythritol 4-phosphate cytidylyltransferase
MGTENSHMSTQTSSPSETACALLVAIPNTFTGETEEYFWRPLHSRPVVEWALAALIHTPAIGKVLLAVSPQRSQMAQAIAARISTKPVSVLSSTAPPLALLATALRLIAADPQPEAGNHKPPTHDREDTASQWLVLHTGNRPFLSPVQLTEALTLAQRSNEAVATAVPMKDTVKIVSADGCVLDTPDRSRLWSLQTPLVLPIAQTRHALARIAVPTMPIPLTGVATALGLPTRIYPGTHENIAITDQEAFAFAEALCTRNLAIGDREPWRNIL